MSYQNRGGGCSRLLERVNVLSDGLKAGANDVQIDMRALTNGLARYRQPNHGRSLVEILITIGPFILLWLLACLSLRVGYGFYLLLALPAAGFLVRLFMIQHDCGHGSLFRHRLVNDWVGRVIGVLTLTPYDFWRRAHGVHHATSGNLDQRGIGDIDTLTVREYLALSRWRRLGYRLYRRLFVHATPSPAVWSGAGRAGTLDQHHGDQRRHCACRGGPDVVGRRKAIPARPPADYLCRRCRWDVAIFRPTPIRTHGVVTRPGLELLEHCALWQLALRSTDRITLVHSEHRHAPHPPLVQSNSFLPVANCSS
jgi:hypothetical protein